MRTRKKITAIPKRVKEFLDLSSSQLEEIEVIENELQELYDAGKLKSNKHFLFLCLRKFLPILTNKQVQTLKEKRDEQKLKIKQRKEEKYRQTYEVSKVKLKSLNLTEEQLQKYVNIKLNGRKLLMEKMKAAKSIEAWDDENSIEMEYIHPIFNADQLELYKEISAKESVRKNIHRIKMESSRFSSLYNIQLSTEQANQLFEKNRIVPRLDDAGEYYSEFEEVELRCAKIKNILTAVQFERYKPHHLQEVKDLENRYKKSNEKQHLEKLNESKGSLNNYIKKILPLQCEARQRIEKILSGKQKKLIEELRKIYFPLLDEKFTTLKASHYKYHKDFCPNELEVFAIADTLDRINPNGNLLKGNKEVNDLMTPELIEIVKKEKIKLNPLFDRIQYIHHEEFEPEEGTVQVGWNIRLQRRKGDEHLKNLGLLLLEPNIEDNLKKISIE